MIELEPVVFFFFFTFISNPVMSQVYDSKESPVKPQKANKFTVAVGEEN